MQAPAPADHRGAAWLRHLPNAISIARMLLVWPLVLLLQERAWAAALWLALVAGASDALDGFLAKRFRWQSRLGGLLDPVADKLLLDACYLGLWGAGHAPTWLVLLVVGRDVVILLGATAWHWLVQPLDARPSLLSKATTLAQVLLVLAWLAQLAWWPAGAEDVQALAWAVAVLTVASGLDYVVRWSLRAWRHQPDGTT